MGKKQEEESCPSVRCTAAKPDDDIDDGTASTRSGSYASSTTPQVLQLTEDEEKEAKRHEKSLREISKIEDRLARGEKVDTLQRAKVLRKSEIENTSVMRKV